jgi:hypothetical protein
LAPELPREIPAEVFIFGWELLEREILHMALVV